MKGGGATTWIPAASLHGWDSVLNLCVSIILTEAKVGGVHFGHPLIKDKIVSRIVELRMQIGGVHFGHPPYQKDKIIG